MPVTWNVTILESAAQLKWKHDTLSALDRIAAALESLASTEDNRERLEEQMLGVAQNSLDVERSMADSLKSVADTLVKIESDLNTQPGPAVKFVAKVGKEIPK